MIKYHDNIHGEQYGDDHMLTNNWNPDKDYGNEYINVYFRINTVGFHCGKFDNDEHHDEFYSEFYKIRNEFKEITWWGNSLRGYAERNFKGGESLHVHPNIISGVLKKNNVKVIAERLANSETFNLTWVDLYRDVYDISDDEYMEKLKPKTNEVIEFLLRNCKTPRVNKYHYYYQIEHTCVSAIGLPRTNVIYYKADDDEVAKKFVRDIVEKLSDFGWLIIDEWNGNTYVRAANKTEIKKNKLNKWWEV